MLTLSLTASACTLASSGTSSSLGAGGADGATSTATSGGAGPGSTTSATTSGTTSSASTSTATTSGTGGNGAGGASATATGSGGASATSGAGGEGGAVISGSGGGGGQGGGSPYPCNGATEFTDPATGHCYYYVDDPDLDWDGAESDCKIWGGHLTRVTDEAERAFINAQPKVISTDLWIGGHDLNDNGVFYWLNNEGAVVATQPPWKVGEPNNPATEHCMKLKSGLFESTPCGGAKEYLCER